MYFFPLKLLFPLTLCLHPVLMECNCVLIGWGMLKLTSILRCECGCSCIREHYVNLLAPFSSLDYRKDGMFFFTELTLRICSYLAAPPPPPLPPQLLMRSKWLHKFIMNAAIFIYLFWSLLA